jgi:transcriptional regulator with XRE-family HTH domain
MGKGRKNRVEQDQAVRLFAARLREVRQSRGMTQAELGRRAHVTASYVWRLESAGASPGIDLVTRLAQALGTTAHDLTPAAAAPDTMGLLREQARGLFEALLSAADRETLLMLNPLLARLVEGAERRS